MRRAESLVVMVIAALFVCSGEALAEKPPGAGNGGGEEVVTPDYGDLIKLYRNENGIPILTDEKCWQPLPKDSCPLDCELVSGVNGPTNDVMVIPVDPATCAIVEACAPCAQEVDFGRMNEARSSEEVFAAQLADLVVNLATADCVTLDPAGRLVTSRVDGGEITSGAIDSPLQNLAIYRQLIMNGYLGDASSPIELPADVLDTAARALGAASDKAGGVDVDLVAYLNQIMGLSDLDTTILGENYCIDMKQEVMGTVREVNTCFLLYGSYDYARVDNFSSLPAPAYIPDETPEEGYFEHLALDNATVPSFLIEQGPIIEDVFDNEPGFEGGNIGGFAQAADDARAVIDYMHRWPVPPDYATPVSCTAAGGTGYDVSISAESGLQVPTQIVDGSEGREFIVTVANAGPDSATGSVIVNAVTGIDGDIFGVVLEDGVYIPVPTDIPPWSFTFTLEPGMSQSFSKLFTVDLGAQSTIEWTATVEAEFDVLESNNSVSATTNVRLTGGGSRR